MLAKGNEYLHLLNRVMLSKDKIMGLLSKTIKLNTTKYCRLASCDKI